MLYNTAAPPGAHAGVSVGGVDRAVRPSWSRFSRSATTARVEDRGSRFEFRGAVQPYVWPVGGKTDLRSMHAVLVYLFVCRGGCSFQHPAGWFYFPFPFPRFLRFFSILCLHISHFYYCRTASFKLFNYCIVGDVDNTRCICATAFHTPPNPVTHSLIRGLERVAARQ